MNERHPDHERLHELLDGRLSAPDRVALEEHLRTCALCQAEQERIRSTRDLLRGSMQAPAAVPETLRERVQAAIEREGRREISPRFKRSWQLAAALAALAVLVTIVVMLQRRRMDFPAEAVSAYTAVDTGEIRLELITSDVQELERWFNSQLDFPSRVLDLGMMGYHLVGGRVSSVGPRRSALFVYRHDRGELLVCEMYEGRVEELPAGAERRTHNDIEFFIFQRNDITAVFWPEGGVVCVLTSRAPRDEVLSLAFAKAMKPAASS
jgi:anti-sigma factor RsiW